MKTKTGLCIRFVSGLCLEAYIVQGVLFTDKMNDFFPLNIVTTFIAIVVLAYITRCCGRVILQVFQKEDMDWKKVVKFID